MGNDLYTEDSINFRTTPTGATISYFMNTSTATTEPALGQIIKPDGPASSQKSFSFTASSIPRNSSKSEDRPCLISLPQEKKQKRQSPNHLSPFQDRLGVVGIRILTLAGGGGLNP